MAPGFKEERTAVFSEPRNALQTYTQSLKSIDRGGELSRLVQSVFFGLEQEVLVGGDNAFLDSRPELSAIVGDKHAIVLSRNRLKPNLVSATVLTYVDDIGDSDVQWPRADQPCTIGSMVEMSETIETPGPAITLMRNLIETGRVKENAEPFRLGTVLNQAASNKGCQMLCTSFRASRTRDQDTDRESYIITAELDVSGTRGYIDGSAEFDTSVLKAENWQRGCPPTVSRFVNNHLQGVVEESLERCLPWSSLNTAQRAARLASLSLDTVKLRGGRRVTRYGIITSEVSRDKAPKKNDPFVVMVQAQAGRMILEIRDSTLGNAHTQASGAPSTPVGATVQSQAGTK